MVLSSEFYLLTHNSFRRISVIIKDVIYKTMDKLHE